MYDESDYLSLEEIPHYENQLASAVNLLSQLKIKLDEIQMKEQESFVVRCSNQFQVISDVEESEASTKEFLSDLQNQQQSEIDELDNLSYDLDKEILEKHQLLDQLNEELNQIQIQNEQRLQDLLRGDQKEDELKQILLQYQEKLSIQNMNNNNLQHLIDRKKQLKEDAENEQIIQRDLLRSVKLEQKKRKAKLDEQEQLLQTLLKLEQEKEDLDLEIQTYTDEQETNIKNLQILINNISSYYEKCCLKTEEVQQDTEKKRPPFVRTPEVRNMQSALKSCFGGETTDFHKYWSNQSLANSIFRYHEEDRNQSLLNIKPLEQEEQVIKQKKRDCFFCGFFG